jgi:DNA-directed RNA polymerase specialized sigma24 family protein
MPAQPADGGVRRPTRGPRRTLTAGPAEIADWVAQARQLGQESELAREQMQAAARGRQQLIGRLYAAGLSQRELAEALGVSSTVIAQVLARSRALARQ